MTRAITATTEAKLLELIKSYPMALVNRRPYGGYVAVPFFVQRHTRRMGGISRNLLYRYRIIGADAELYRRGEKAGSLCDICGHRIICASVAKGYSRRFSCVISPVRYKQQSPKMLDNEPQFSDPSETRTISDLALMLQVRPKLLSREYIALIAKRAEQPGIYQKWEPIAESPLKRAWYSNPETGATFFVDLPKNATPAAKVSIGDRFDSSLGEIKPPYARIHIRKRRGGVREIFAPSDALKHIQRAIVDRILNPIKLPENITAFTPNSNIVKNAEFHVGKEVVTCMDLSDFFPSIGAGRVHTAFMRLGYSRDIATVLTKLTTYEGKLVQGPPTSPALANLCFLPTDTAVGKVAAAYKYTYSRYADDLVFSANGKGRTAVKRFLDVIKQILESHGFKVNDAKTKMYRAPGPRIVTGLIVDDRVRLRKGWLKRIETSLYRLRQGKPIRNSFSNMMGLASFIGMVEPERGAEMRQLLESLKDSGLFSSAPSVENEAIPAA